MWTPPGHLEWCPTEVSLLWGSWFSVVWYLVVHLFIYFLIPCGIFFPITVSSVHLEWCPGEVSLLWVS